MSLTTIELSDSEDELPIPMAKNSKTNSGTVSISSENSNTSVIEIVPSDEENKAEEINSAPEISSSVVKSDVVDQLKRMRDKSPQGVSETDLCDSPSKRSKGSNNGNDCIKKDFVCPHCLKPFPSENSLNTHMQHHSLEDSVRNSKRKLFVPSSIEYKHRCDKCQKTFKNSILLSRHECMQIRNRSNNLCNICQKSFKDVAMLNIHKKAHTKENLLNNTNNIRICPTKFKSPVRKSLLPRKSISVAPEKLIVSRPSTTIVKSPKQNSKIYQCKDCKKVCSSQDILNIHEKSHKKFTCISCRATFPSKILHDDHLRTSCVKIASPSLRRLSFKVPRSSTVSRAPCDSKVLAKPSSQKGVSLRDSKNLSNISIMKSEPLDMQVSCDKCNKKFRTLTAMFKHKVKVHGVHTPDKKFMQEQKKKLYKPLATHCGIPASEKLRKIWGAMEEATKNKPVS